VRPRRRIRGADDAAVDVRSSPFRCCAILRARVAGGDERDRSAGTSEHTDRASDLLRRERERERERERVLLSEQEWPSFCGERASGVERIRHRHTDEITTCVSDVRKKMTLVPIKGDASYKHVSPVRTYR
jgi:hypothetical protein